MKASPSVVLRADADSTIGAGHIRRLLALSSALQRAGCATILASTSLTPALERQAHPSVVESSSARAGSNEDAEWTAALARSRGALWVALDGYQFDASYQRAIRSAGLRLLVADDFGQLGPYAADVIVNQNVFASEEMYAGNAGFARVLLGPAYALLRPEFREARADETPAQARRILVTLGGADPANLSVPVTTAVLRLPDPDVRVTVVIGPVNADDGTSLERIGDRRLTVVTATSDMAALMREADVAITGAGVTVYELCALGVPAIVLPIVPGQEAVARALTAAGLSIDLGSADVRTNPNDFARAIERVIGDRAAREAVRRTGRLRVDGLGADRVVTAMSL